MALFHDLGDTECLVFGQDGARLDSYLWLVEMIGGAPLGQERKESCVSCRRVLH